MKQLKEVLLSHKESIFEKALFYSNGDATLALEKIFHVTIWIAKKYKQLANKNRALELFYERLAIQSFKRSQQTISDDVKTVIEDAFNLYQQKRKRIIVASSLGLLVMVMLAVVYPIMHYYVMPKLNTETHESNIITTATNLQGDVILPVIGEVTMKDTKTIKGDNKVIFFENYHNLSKSLQKDTTPNIIHADIYTEIERYAASVTAPDGTSYMVFNNITNEDAGNITFGLYRMETNGWNKVAEGESQVMHNSGSYENYFASRIYLVADNDSNIYVVVLLDDKVVMYKYDAKNGDFGLLDSTLSCCAPSKTTAFYVYYDEIFGRSGGIYVGYSQKNQYNFACYDIDQDKYVDIAEKVCSSNNTNMMFCVNDTNIHMVAQTGYSLQYYRIESDGTFKRLTLFSGSMYADVEFLFNRNSGSGGITIDKNGIVHIIATHRSYASEDTVPYAIVHYKIMYDMTYEKATLSKLYYNDTDAYDPMCIGVFAGENSEIYYIEKYKAYATDNMNVLAFGKLNEDGTVTCLDVIELPNAITRGGTRLMDHLITFYSDNDIYYFSVNIEN